MDFVVLEVVRCASHKLWWLDLHLTTSPVDVSWEFVDAWFVLHELTFVPCPPFADTVDDETDDDDNGDHPTDRPTSDGRGVIVVLLIVSGAGDIRAGAGSRD